MAVEFFDFAVSIVAFSTSLLGGFLWAFLRKRAEQTAINANFASIR